jgi:hypothetical protein
MYMSKKGGYRQGSGRAKIGYYKGIYCGSTYELCWVIYSLDHNIEFERFPTKLEKDGIIYYPDFLLGDGKTIIETKGFECQKKVAIKTKIAESLGYTVNVLRKDDLKHVFSYVEKTYSTKKFYELYDNYKPKYTYQCDCCSKEFVTDNKRKLKNKFCSRVCSGRGHQGKMTDEVKEKISKSLVGRKYDSYKRKYKQVWINNGFTNTRIKQGEALPDGFTFGRITLP